jgi:hypothetical protein
VAICRFVDAVALDWSWCPCGRPAGLVGGEAVAVWLRAAGAVWAVLVEPHEGVDMACSAAMVAGFPVGRQPFLHRLPELLGFPQVVGWLGREFFCTTPRRQLC